MMYDAALLLDTGLTSTVSSASNDYIDTLAAGNDYKGCIFRCLTTTAHTATGAPNVQFSLITSSSSSFTAGTTYTMCLSATFTASALAAGKYVDLYIPPGARRYIKGYKQVNTTNPATIFLTAGVVKMFILEDVDVTIDARKQAIQTQ